jgi:hypothetical protein
MINPIMLFTTIVSHILSLLAINKSPMFTQARQSVNSTATVASGSESHMPSGWSKDGLLTFDKLAKEVQADHDKHRLEFDMFFKKEMNEMAIVAKSQKRKSECVNIDND